MGLNEQNPVLGEKENKGAQWEEAQRGQVVPSSGDTQRRGLRGQKTPLGSHP